MDDKDLHFSFGVSEILEGVTMHVTVKNYSGWKMRLRFSLWLIEIACKIASLNAVIDDGRD